MFDYIVWNDLYSVGSVKTLIKVIKLFVLLDPSDQCQKISHGKSSSPQTFRLGTTPRLIKIKSFYLDVSWMLTQAIEGINILL